MKVSQKQFQSDFNGDLGNLIASSGKRSTEGAGIAGNNMNKYLLEGKSVGVLMNIVEQIAETEFDGHYSIFSFTTNYRVGFGTVMDSWQFKSVPAFPTLKEALIDAIVNKTRWL